MRGYNTVLLEITALDTNDVCLHVVHFIANTHQARPLLYMAYFFVQSLACWLYFGLSVLNSLAISGTSGSSGLGSHNNEQMESKTLDTVRAGDHWDRRISKQMLPLEFILGW